MKQGSFTITENRQLTPSTYRMRLAGDISAITAPGQFINIKLDGHFLRRPISVCDAEPADAASAENRGIAAGGSRNISRIAGRTVRGSAGYDKINNGRTGTDSTNTGRASADRAGIGDGYAETQGIVTIIYKVLGCGTEEMTHLKPGRVLDVLTGLGNGYDLSCAGDRPLLIGGGVGIPPLYLAAKRLMAMQTKSPVPEHSDGKSVNVILGFNSADEVYYADEFAELGCNVKIATADGSLGTRGFVTDAFRLFTAECSAACMIDGNIEYASPTHFYTCGPEPMLKAVFNDVYKEAGISGQMSFEERMGCGFGACMGCSIRVKGGQKRICKDGPVLRTEEILW